MLQYPLMVVSLAIFSVLLSESTDEPLVLIH